MKTNYTDVHYTFSEKLLLHVCHSPPWPAKQLFIVLLNQAPYIKRQPGPERFVLHWIEHVIGHWNIKAVKSNEASRLPFESCLCDSPLFQIIVLDSQMCPSLKMLLMSHLVSGDLRAGFDEEPKVCVFYWEYGRSVSSVGNWCNGLLGNYE